jgi:pimeloyl-CoA synthetase
MQNRDPEIRQLNLAVAKMLNNDLPHMTARLNHMDVKLAKIEQNVAWCMRLLIGFAIVAVTILLGVTIELFTSLESL